MRFRSAAGRRPAPGAAVGHRLEADEARLDRAAALAAGAGRDRPVRVREGLNEPPPETLLLLDGKERCVCKLTGRGWECPWGRNKGGGIRRRRVPGDIRLEGLPATPGPSDGAEACNRTSSLVRRRTKTKTPRDPERFAFGDRGEIGRGAGGEGGGE